MTARTEALARLAEERWDLVVIGGGIVGAGVLLDATSRGLKAALVEQDDLAVDIVAFLAADPRRAAVPRGHAPAPGA